MPPVPGSRPPSAVPVPAVPAPAISAPARRAAAADWPPVATPVERVNPAAAGPVVLLCDHASRAIPDGGTLGLDPAVLFDHIAWDIGAAVMARVMAARLDAVAVLAGWSRLFIDCNRAHGHAGLVPPASDGRPIPGNTNLDAAAIRHRVTLAHDPYHHAVDAEIRRRCDRGQAPVVVAVHSFTPQLGAGGAPRPWHVGVMGVDRDGLAPALITRLRAEDAATGGPWVVGDNQPYSAAGDLTFSLAWHGTRHGFRHAQFEVRQDLVATPDTAAAWGERLARHVAAVVPAPVPAPLPPRPPAA